MALELWWGSGSPYSWRALLALEYKQLPYVSHLVQFAKQEHKAPAAAEDESARPRAGAEGRRLRLLRVAGDPAVPRSQVSAAAAVRPHGRGGRHDHARDLRVPVVRRRAHHARSSTRSCSRASKAAWRRSSARCSFVLSEARTIEQRLSHVVVAGRRERSRPPTSWCFPGIQMLLRALERREAQDLRGALAAAGSELPGDRRVDQPRRGAARLRAHLSAALEGVTLATNSVTRHRGQRCRTLVAARQVSKLCRSSLPVPRRVLAMPEYPVHVAVSRPPGLRRFRQYRPGRVAARSCVTSASRPSASRSSRRTRRAATRRRSTASSSSVNPLTRDNYRQVLEPLLGARRFPAEPVGRRFEHRADQVRAREGRAVSRHLHRAVARRLHRSESVSPSRRTNYALREEALALRKSHKNGPTAVLTHGANPGLVSHFVKQALLNHRGRHRRRRRQSEHARGVGGARAQARRQGDSHRRARHAGRERAEAPRRVRQHLVGRRLRQRRLRSRPSSAGARTRRSCRRAASATISARSARSTCCSPARARACARGHRRPGRSTAS